MRRSTRRQTTDEEAGRLALQYVVYRSQMSAHEAALAEDRVRAKHFEKRTVTCNAVGPSLGAYYCAGCSKPYPCPTIRALEGK